VVITSASSTSLPAVPVAKHVGVLGRGETVGARLGLLGHLQTFSVAFVAVFVATRRGHKICRIGQSASGDSGVV
jgi:hypothetical protein